jgi:hypothetical protein
LGWLIERSIQFNLIDYSFTPILNYSRLEKNKSEVRLVLKLISSTLGSFFVCK